MARKPQPHNGVQEWCPDERTVGKLVRVEQIFDGLAQIPISVRNRPVSSTDSSSLSEYDQDATDVYILHVKWLSPDQPFAESGDSGSLVFAKVDSHVVPLGIHYGSVGGISKAYMLHSWWEEMEKLFGDADIYLCNPLECPSIIQT